MLPDLKSCPFCGKDAQLKEISGRWAVECSNKCAATVIKKDRNAVIKIWNKRVNEKIQHMVDAVVEYCPECRTEIEMRWNTERDGYEAFCPVCGNRLMLCDECKHRNGGFYDDCDYDGATDSCKFNRH